MAISRRSFSWSALTGGGGLPGRSGFGFGWSTRLQRGRRHFERRQSLAIQVLQFEHRDLLRLAVFEQRELILLQIFDRFAAFVFDGDVDDDEVRVGPEGRRRLVLRQQSQRKLAPPK